MSRLLELEDLRAGYDRVPALHGVDLHVDEGEVVAMLGANGAGKTTTLLTISGLLPVMGGSIDLFGQGAPSSRRPHLLAARGLAHVPEDRGIFSQLSVAENLRLARAPGDAIVEAVGWFSDLEPLLGRRAGLLSGGEQQMLALARALVSKPRLLLVDELSLGLAPIVVERLLPVLATAASSEGLGVLLVEQHIHLALEVADRGYVLSNGRVTLQGSAADLAARPDVVAASYMGDAG